MGSYDFNGCTSLEKVKIGNNVSKIPKCAFQKCTALTEIEIPESVTSIGYFVFDGCANLGKVTFYNNKDCEIFCTIPNKETVAIFGYEGSEAQKYAEKYGYQFYVIGTEIPTEQGDINADRAVNVLDVVALQKYLHKQNSFTEKQFQTADMNGDGNVNVVDLALLKQNLEQIKHHQISIRSASHSGLFLI